ncbi:MAG: family 43 glycosylhydrolase [Candidatus Cryptobacteroides sp.]
MKTKVTLFAAVLLLCGGLLPAQTVRTEDLYIRDPFVLVDRDKGIYYLYRSKPADPAVAPEDVRGVVEVFKSTDLENWEGPKTVLTVPDDNWITGRIWAPEVHRYKGKYYIFATLNTDLIWKGPAEGLPPYFFRGTQVFWSKSPEGPFKAFGSEPYTPMDQMCLDGTLWVEDGRPWMVYCHEWVETVDGEMMVRPLKKDLSGPAGEPLRLFCASAAPWRAPEAKVTDGPFLYRTVSGKLLMIWSNMSPEGYAIGIAESVTGKVTGPWKHHEKPLFEKDGGHGMIFRTLEGKLCLTLHAPNGGGLERAHFFELEDTGDGLRLKTAWDEDEFSLICGPAPTMRVLTVEDPADSLLLRKVCEDFTPDQLMSSELGLLAEKMVATVTSPEQDGVGIAGPQVGLSRRIVAVQRFDKEGEPFEVYPNIRIVARRGEKVAGPEGCLSVPGKRGEVLRYRDIDITYSLVDGQVRDTTETVTGFTAVIFQHECDHLEGVLYTDY